MIKRIDLENFTSNSMRCSLQNPPGMYLRSFSDLKGNAVGWNIYLYEFAFSISHIQSCQEGKKEKSKKQATKEVEEHVASHYFLCYSGIELVNYGILEEKNITAIYTQKSGSSLDSSLDAVCNLSYLMMDPSLRPLALSHL